MSAFNEIAKALATAQSEFSTIVKNKTNPHFKSKYADLAAVIDAVRPALTKNGLTVSQVLRLHADGNGVYLETVLMHSSGQIMTSSYPIAHGLTPQQMGSALTYARRYSLCAILGVAADEDDDGGSAEAGAGKKPDAEKKPAQKGPAKKDPTKIKASEVMHPGDMTIGFGKNASVKFKDASDKDLQRLFDWIESNEVKTEAANEFKVRYQRWVEYCLDQETRVTS